MKERKIHRGEIYYVDLNPARGSEQGGIRPCIVLQSNLGNKHSPTIIVAAITGRVKKPLPTHVPVQHGVLPRESEILLEQIRTVDKRRVFRYMGKISEAQMRTVERAIDISLGMPYLEGLRRE